jgi:LasA protease
MKKMRPGLPALLVLLVGLGWVAACQRTTAEPTQTEVGFFSVPATTATPSPEIPVITPLIPLTRGPDEPLRTPTPDAPHLLPTPRTAPDDYVVRSGDTLARIAQRYGVSYQMIADANEIANPNLISVGQELTIPPPEPQENRPDFKIIPDSELVYGPYSAHFETEAFIRSQDGYLSSYEEELGERLWSGAEILQRVAQDYSVNPRLLLAVLEYQSGWVTERQPSERALDYPMGLPDPGRKSLYLQLTFAANELNRGYYLWRVNAIATWVLADGAVLLPSPIVNAGTAGLQMLFSKLYGRTGWEEAVGPQGLIRTYIDLFGYPFDYTYHPLLPASLRQPELQLPFEPGVVWSFTGGPHGGWGDGSGWAAIDFAPPGEALGCVQSNAWVTAMADGLVVRSGDGVVVQDLDGDGLEQTGWTILYLHIETRNRVPEGTLLKAGDRIGHPSCEGGFSTGTHVHLARRYNGEWMPADGPLPFVMDGWISVGTGVEYNGYLVKDGQTTEAWNGRAPQNQIRR